MIIGYLMVISVSLALILWLLKEYAVSRAKYLVSMELGPLYDDVVEDEKTDRNCAYSSVSGTNWGILRVT